MGAAFGSLSIRQLPSKAPRYRSSRKIRKPRSGTICFSARWCCSRISSSTVNVTLVLIMHSVSAEVSHVHASLEHDDHRVLGGLVVSALPPRRWNHVHPAAEIFDPRVREHNLVEPRLTGAHREEHQLELARPLAPEG